MCVVQWSCSVTIPGQGASLRFYRRRNSSKRGIYSWPFSLPPPSPRGARGVDSIIRCSPRCGISRNWRRDFFFFLSSFLSCLGDHQTLSPLRVLSFLSSFLFNRLCPSFRKKNRAFWTLKIDMLKNASLFFASCPTDLLLSLIARAFPVFYVVRHTQNYVHHRTLFSPVWLPIALG